MSRVATRQSPALRTASTAFIALWLILAAFPFLWTLWGSFKVELDFFSKADWIASKSLRLSGAFLSFT